MKQLFSYILRPLQNVQFCSSSRKAKILTGGIYLIFRGLKFEPDTDTLVKHQRSIGQKGMFCNGLILSILLTVCFVSILPAKTACADGIRKAVWAGRFYPASRSELEQTIDSLTFQAKQTHVQIPRLF
jgi:hypothetical protein